MDVFCLAKVSFREAAKKFVFSRMATQTLKFPFATKLEGGG